LGWRARLLRGGQIASVNVADGCAKCVRRPATLAAEKPKALNMPWNSKQVPTQKGRIAIVTGAKIGLGYETALGLAAKGCSVVLACRNIEKAEAAKASILAQHPKAVVDCMALDLASPKSVRKFAAAYKRRHDKLDLPINNAGIMMPPNSLSEDGFESQLAAIELRPPDHVGQFSQQRRTGDQADSARAGILQQRMRWPMPEQASEQNVRVEYCPQDAWSEARPRCLRFA
jgi:hypothetical protein